MRGFVDFDTLIAIQGQYTSQITALPEPQAASTLMELIHFRSKAIHFLDRHHQDPDIIEELKRQEPEMLEQYFQALRGYMQGRYDSRKFIEALNCHLDELQYVLREAEEADSIDNIGRLLVYLFADPDTFLEEMKFIEVAQKELVFADTWESHCHIPAAQGKYLTAA